MSVEVSLDGTIIVDGKPLTTLAFVSNESAEIQRLFGLQQPTVSFGQRFLMLNAMVSDCESVFLSFEDLIETFILPTDPLYTWFLENQERISAIPDIEKVIENFVNDLWWRRLDWWRFQLKKLKIYLQHLPEFYAVNDNSSTEIQSLTDWLSKNWKIFVDEPTIQISLDQMIDLHLKAFDNELNWEFPANDLFSKRLYLYKWFEDRRSYIKKKYKNIDNWVMYFFSPLPEWEENIIRRVEMIKAAILMGYIK